MTSPVSSFNTLAAAIGNARSPTVTSRVGHDLVERTGSEGEGLRQRRQLEFDALGSTYIASAVQRAT